MGPDSSLIMEVGQLLNRFVGKKMWGAVTSVAWLSIEIGDPWDDFKTVRTYGEFSLFVGCYWEMRQKGQRVIDNDMEQTSDWEKRAETFFEGKYVRSVEFSPTNHRFSLFTNTDEELCVSPKGSESSLDEWAVFFRVPPSERHWYSLNSLRIEYDS